jgi:hypothetical protein
MMKFVITVAALFLLLSMLMGKARKSGKLNEAANKAVGSLANAMRYFVYGLLTIVAVVCAVLLYHMD